MATRLKTVEYAFPVLGSLINNTLTDLSQITINLPESGKVFRSVELRVTMDDIITATGGSVTTKTVNLRLGAAAYSSTTNANTLSHSAENMSLLLARDFTGHFDTSWSGSSMTCDAQLQINQSTGTTLGQVNVCARLYITYEYDDTSTTQVKTVYIPLNAPATLLGTTRPASFDTIPNLDTYLPEASKTYRDRFIWFGANSNQATAVDHILSFQIDAATAETTGNYGAALQTDRWTEYIYKPTFTTNATHELRVWTSTGAVPRHHTPQIYLVVTYEFNASTTTSVMNSLLLPMEWESPAGISETVFQRAERELWVQEPSPTLQRAALYVDYETPVSPASNYRFRVGAESWIQYTNTGSAVIAGQKGLMVRNDSAIMLTRGRNTLQADCYSSSPSITPTNISSLWVVNYTSGVAPGGLGAHNHTVIEGIFTHGTGTATAQVTSAAAPFAIIPEPNYFIASAGMIFEWVSNAATNVTGVIVQAERLVSEGGLKFESVYVDANATDPEPGTHTNYAQARTLFNRWAGDTDAKRIDIEAPRRFQTAITSTVMSGAAAFHLRLASIITYHSITYDITDSVAGFTGTVDIDLHRANSGERVLSTSRTGDGSFTFTWYDNTEELYTQANDGANVGRSQDTLAS